MLRILATAAVTAATAGVLLAAPAAASDDVSIQITCGSSKSGRTGTGTCSNLGGHGWRLGIRCTSGGLVQHFYNPSSGWAYDPGTRRKTCPSGSTLTHAWTDIN